MDILTYILVVLLQSTFHSCPRVYKDLMCEEPIPGYGQALLSLITFTSIPRVCPAPVEVFWSIINEVLMKLMALVVICCTKNIVLKVLAASWKGFIKINDLFLEWKRRPVRCRYCKCTPCQVKRKCLWMPNKPRPKHISNHVERSQAMYLFNQGLEIYATLLKELEKDELYWERSFIKPFQEEHMELFPRCIRDQINYWYPVPDGP